MGRYFYRPLPAVAPAYDELGRDIGSGLERGVQNFQIERERQRQEARQVEADRWEKARNAAWLAAQGGGPGVAPTTEAEPIPTPRLDFGRGSAGIGVQMPRPEVTTTDTGGMMGPAGRALTRGRFEGYLTEPDVPQPGYIQLGDVGYIRNPDELADERDEREFGRERRQAGSLADEAWAREYGQRRVEAANPIPYNPDADPEYQQWLERQKEFERRGLSGTGGFRPNPPSQPRDPTIGSFDSVFQELLRSYEILDQGVPTGRYSRSRAQIADEAREIVARSRGGAVPLPGRGAGQDRPWGGQGPVKPGRMPEVEAGEAEVEPMPMPAVPDAQPPDGMSFLEYTGITTPEPGAPAGEPTPADRIALPEVPFSEYAGLLDASEVEGIRAELQDAGIDPSEWAAVLEQNGYGPEEIEQIVGG